MKRTIVLVAVTLISAVILSGCAHISGGVAPSNVPLAAGSYTVIGETRGNDCVYYLFGLIPVSGGNETKNAVAKAISNASGANALINVSADTYSQFFVLVSRTCTQVNATAVAIK